MKNWKTTVAGLLVAAIAAAEYLHYITVEQGMAIIGVLTSLGFIVAKDNNVTGGTKPQ